MEEIRRGLAPGTRDRLAPGTGRDEQASCWSVCRYRREVEMRKYWRRWQLPRWRSGGLNSRAGCSEGTVPGLEKPRREAGGVDDGRCAAAGGSGRGGGGDGAGAGGGCGGGRREDDDGCQPKRSLINSMTTSCRRSRPGSWHRRPDGSAPAGTCQRASGPVPVVGEAPLPVWHLRPGSG